MEPSIVLVRVTSLCSDPCSDGSADSCEHCAQSFMYDMQSISRIFLVNTAALHIWRSTELRQLFTIEIKMSDGAKRPMTKAGKECSAARYEDP